MVNYKRMVGKMIEDLDGRSRFTHFRKRDFGQAGMPHKAGFDTWDRVRKITEEARENLREDSRWAGIHVKSTQFSERNLQSL